MNSYRTEFNAKIDIEALKSSRIESDLSSLRNTIQQIASSNATFTQTGQSNLAQGITLVPVGAPSTPDPLNQNLFQAITPVPFGPLPPPPGGLPNIPPSTPIGPSPSGGSQNVTPAGAPSMQAQTPTLNEVYSLD